MRALAFLPLTLMLLLGLVFLARLGQGGATNEVPSALLGEPAPTLNLTPLASVDTPHLTGGDLASPEGELTLLNVWASWCTPCHAEHPFITELSGLEGVRMVGLNYKDEERDARAFLERRGNPYAALGADREGSQSIELGVYGVPETFLIDAAGVVRAKYVGPITADRMTTEVLPAIRVLSGQAG